MHVLLRLLATICLVGLLTSQGCGSHPAAGRYEVQPREASADMLAGAFMDPSGARPVTSIAPPPNPATDDTLWIISYSNAPSHAQQQQNFPSQSPLPAPFTLSEERHRLQQIGPLAQVHSHYVFSQESDQPQSCQLALPLAYLRTNQHGALNGLSLKIGPRHIRGVLLPVKQAQALHQQATKDNLKTILISLDQTGQSATLSIGAIPPKTSCEVTLSHIRSCQWQHDKEALALPMPAALSTDAVYEAHLNSGFQWHHDADSPRPLPWQATPGRPNHYHCTGAPLTKPALDTPTLQQCIFGFQSSTAALCTLSPMGCSAQ